MGMRPVERAEIGAEFPDPQSQIGGQMEPRDIAFLQVGAAILVEAHKKIAPGPGVDNGLQSQFRFLQLQDRFGIMTGIMRMTGHPLKPTHYADIGIQKVRSL